MSESLQEAEHINSLEAQYTRMNLRLTIILTVYYLVLCVVSDSVSLELLASLYAIGVGIGFLLNTYLFLKRMSKYWDNGCLELLYVALISHLLYPLPFIVLAQLI